MAYNYCPYSAYAHKKGSEHPNHNTPLPVAALETTRSWRARDTIWAPRQRQGGGGVCPEDSGGLDRQAFSLGQQVFDAEIFAIYHALRIFQARQKSGRRYTVFSDSPSAIRRALSDALEPGQQWARAIIEAAYEIMARGNEIALFWVPAHSRVARNEVVDDLAEEAAEGTPR